MFIAVGAVSADLFVRNKIGFSINDFDAAFGRKSPHFARYNPELARNVMELKS